MKMIKNKITHILIDFDGVLTDNFVYIDENGLESVRCSRSDGLAFDILKKLKYQIYIFSTEKNPVVAARAKKLNIDVIQGIGNKKEHLQELAKNKSLNLDNFLYIGNDLNDLGAMTICGVSACPQDSHEEIKKVATFVLKKNGGAGIMRDVLSLLNINEIEYFK